MNDITKHTASDPHLSHEMHHVHLPAPTAWPFVLALGLILVFASLLVSPLVGVLGAVLTIVAAVGWFRDVLPHEQHIDLIAPAEDHELEPLLTKVAKVHVTEEHRAMLPLKTFSFSSGILGGIIGGIAMVIPAEIYGVLRYHSIWYVVNLLGGAGVGDWINPTAEQMSHFRMEAFVTANIIQGVTTLLVGVLYGALLPMLPKRPILLGGLIAPVLWTGLLHSILGLVNPFLQARIDWWSFAASQVLFGVVAGWVVVKRGKMHRLESMPLVVRMGLEVSGLHPHDPDEPNGDKQP